MIGSGDASIVFEGPTNWVVGLDNSASDQFVIGNDTALGTDDSLRITTAGAITIKEGSSYPSVTKGIAKAWGQVNTTNNTISSGDYNLDTMTNFATGISTLTGNVTASGTLTVTGTTTHNGDVVLATTKKLKLDFFQYCFSFRKKSFEKHIFTYVDPKFSQDSKNHT